MILVEFGRSPVLNTLFRILTPHEQARANWYRTPMARAEFVIARATVRLLTGRNNPLQPLFGSQRWRGKPKLSHGPHLSIAHTPGAVLVAVSSVPIGVDLEHAKRPADWDSVARALFSTIEQQLVRERPDLAVRIWVAKEALSKASGRGLAADWRQIDTMGGQGGAVLHAGRQWRLRAMHVAPYVVAAAAASIEPLKFWRTSVVRLASAVRTREMSSPVRTRVPA
jgi:phosphopantetheinyl transferase